MREIPLTRGKVAMVDDADYEWLMQWKWCARPTQWKDSQKVTWYACRRIRKGERAKRVGNISMHTVIMGMAPGEDCDHRDGNGLNNQRFNLRPCNDHGNNGNKGLPRNNSSGLKGVSLARDRNRTKKWKACIFKNGKPVQLGRFLTKREAGMAYDVAALEYFGEFAKTNAMMGLL